MTRPSSHNSSDTRYRPEFALIAGGASLGVVFLLIVAKGIAFSLSDSASVFASLMDSLSDAAGSAASFLAIRMSLRPADSNHRSGHGKIEGLAAVVQALLIFGAGIALATESVRRFGEAQAVGHQPAAIAIMVFSIVVSLALVAVQRRVLKSAPSLAVEADSVHYAMDIAVNLGVIVVLVALAFGAPPLVDPLFAVGVALYLVVTARGIGAKGLDMLLDRELPQDTRDDIARIIRAQPGVLGLHDLRTGKSGMRMVITFDIEADGALPLSDAHEIARSTESVLLETYPLADIMIHIDPLGDRDDSRHTEKAIQEARVQRPVQA